MQKARAAAVSINEADPRDKEFKEIMNALEFPATLDHSMLLAVDPSKWKNVGPAVSHAITILLTQAGLTGQNFSHLKLLLDRFVKKTMTFMKSNDNEIALMKNKVTREIQTSERDIDKKIKAFKTSVEVEQARIE